MDNAYFVYIWSFLSTITVSCCKNDDLMSQLILHDLFVLTLHISCTLMTILVFLSNGNVTGASYKEWIGVASLPNSL